jgi:hypothetical protein
LNQKEGYAHQKTGLFQEGSHDHQRDISSENTSWPEMQTRNYPSPYSFGPWMSRRQRKTKSMKKKKVKSKKGHEAANIQHWHAVNHTK